jgi:hypothetical protein
MAAPFNRQVSRVLDLLVIEEERATTAEGWAWPRWLRGLIEQGLDL